jgi:hypothetical protein
VNNVKPIVKLTLFYFTSGNYSQRLRAIAGAVNKFSLLNHQKIISRYQTCLDAKTGKPPPRAALNGEVIYRLRFKTRPSQARPFWPWSSVSFA